MIDQGELAAECGLVCINRATSTNSIREVLSGGHVTVTERQYAISDNGLSSRAAEGIICVDLQLSVIDPDDSRVGAVRSALVVQFDCARSFLGETHITLKPAIIIHADA